MLSMEFIRDNPCKAKAVVPARGRAARPPQSRPLPEHHALGHEKGAPST